MKTIIIAFVSALLFSLLFGAVFIKVLKKKRADQPIYEYVYLHKGKSGTPTFGGFIIYLPLFVLFVLFGCAKNENARLILTISIAFMSVGFIDDYLKIASDKNEGLKPYQKMILLFAISVLYGFIAYKKGITGFYVPFSKIKTDLGIWSAFIITFVFIAISNCVNLTDGLDGLASSVSIVYVLAAAAIIYIEAVAENNTVNIYEIMTLSALSVGCFCGFLCFNLNPAKIFMGDTGSLATGGLLGGICVFTGNSFYIPFIGIMFVLSGISVIMQVLYYKRTKKRIFKMAPLHHHLELSGVSECKIAFYYSIVTLVVSLIVIFTMVM